MWFLEKKILFVKFYVEIRLKTKCSHKTACAQVDFMLMFAECFKRELTKRKQLKGVTK